MRKTLRKNRDESGIICCVQTTTHIPQYFQWRKGHWRSPMLGENHIAHKISIMTLPERYCHFYLYNVFFMFTLLSVILTVNSWSKNKNTIHSPFPGCTNTVLVSLGFLSSHGRLRLFMAIHLRSYEVRHLTIIYNRCPNRSNVIYLNTLLNWTYIMRTLCYGNILKK